MKPDRKLIDEIIANNDAIEAFCNPGPGAPAWDGSGLPPVGVECEAHAGDITSMPSGEREVIWSRVKVIAHDEGIVVFRWLGEMKGQYAFYRDAESFRPLKTPGQREREIDALVTQIVYHYGAPKMSEHYLGLATALYDAGYRKVTDQ